MALRDRRGKQQDAFKSAMKAKRAGDLSGWFGGIRKIYELEADEIERGNYDPYIVDWSLIFTPIEFDAWYSIRSGGHRMYPQFPVGRYFADFADPWARVIVECDGKEWHDKERDKRRDRDLARAGWWVHRIEGWRCRLDEDHPEGSHAYFKNELDWLTYQDE